MHKSISEQLYNEINNQEITKYYDQCLYDKLDRYVFYTCYMRDASHGHAHMKQVVNNSLYIWHKMNYNTPSMDKTIFANILISSAWLHDVADHKYDKDDLLKKNVQGFLQVNMPEYVNIIQEIIEYISFSKQKKKEDSEGKINWLNIFNENIALIRHIVSDSDKIEALGYNGIIRCLKYGHETSKTKERQEVIEHLKEHADHKLLKLHGNYIITLEGLEVSKKLHKEFEDILNNDNLLIEIYEENIIE